MGRLTLTVVLLVLLGSAAMAQDRRGTRFWNLTANTVKQLYLSPAGTGQWGPDQCRNDKDGEVDHDERLRVTAVQSGRYDVRLHDVRGRVCVVRNVEVKEGAVFTIEEKQLTECGSR